MNRPPLRATLQFGNRSPHGVSGHEAAAVLEALLAVIVEREWRPSPSLWCGACSGNKPGTAERSATSKIKGNYGNEIRIADGANRAVFSFGYDSFGYDSYK